ncbi:multiheme c-type cytochrome [Tautonia rosea]|uniref:multiheme c-type cytochrome n=1 Tax=Tautonia rosea TaxID=2728037 RepID=UPI00147627E5|nr:multiheme c-type cytochrome [Tautonia rosea]
MTDSRSPWRAVASVLIGAAILVYVGCSSNTPPEATDRVKPSIPADPNDDLAEDIEDDDRHVDAVLIVSGQQYGYLEPCGCTEGQTGGLGRRADLMNQLREQGQELLAIDLGSIIADPASSRAGPDQIRIKQGIGLEALARLGYQALALSADDLEIGLGEFVGQYLSVPDAPPLLATNIQPAEGLEETFRESIQVKVGGLSVGILAVVDPRTITALNDPEQDFFFQRVLDPMESVQVALPSLQSETDLQVLMVQGPSDLARTLAEAFPEVEIVVGKSEYEYAPARPERLHDGTTTLVLVGKKGQQVGVLDLFAATPDRPRYRRVRLDSRYHDIEPIRSLLGEEYLNRLDQNDVVENYPRRPHPSGARFVGAETCKNCHPNTYQKWSTTKHAYAWPAIETGARGNRTMDAECVSCHATGFEYESGFVNLATTPHLRNQQCENCHGPGSLHITDPMNWEYRSQMVLTREEAEQSLCIRCHDSDNDPHWDFSKRWPMVAHPKLDRYDDPKVRQGLDPNSLPVISAQDDAAEGD